MALKRIRADEVQAGDRFGDGRWQGVRIINAEHWPNANGRSIHLSLGNHGMVEYSPGTMILVERTQ